jgi:FixJ family two-component response regulator
MMTPEGPIVFVVDDDPSMRPAMESLIRSIGLRVKSFPSAHDFLHYERPDAPACLVLDVRLPGLSGLDLQHELLSAGNAIPIIFITGHGDIPMSVQAIKAGAADFLTKPVDSEALLSAVRAAIEQDVSAHQARAEIAGFEHRLATLTSREREVLAAVVKGKLNKQIAGDLGIVEQTVKFHRARIMERMQARTVAELMHIAARLGIEAAASETRATPSSNGTAPKTSRS